MRKFALIFMAAAALMAATAQRSKARGIKDLFIAMPDSLMPMLDENARKDLVDICLSGMKTSLPNEWRGSSALTALTDTYLRLREDSEGAATTDMALLPAGKDTLVCLVRTLLTPTPISSIQFFSSIWRELRTEKYIKLPSFSDFTTDESKLTPGVLPVVMMQMRLSAPEGDAPQLEVQTNLSINTFKYRWSGKKFISH